MSLIDDAIEARKNAYAPYSKFDVGAALRTPTGEVFKGVNVENVAYPEGTCAEAMAIAAMVLEGFREIDEIAVIADSPDPITPCGGCRQKLAEFADANTKITMATMDGKQVTMSMTELLPGAFATKHMERAE